MDAFSKRTSQTISHTIFKNPQNRTRLNPRTDLILSCFQNLARSPAFCPVQKYTVLVCILEVWRFGLLEACLATVITADKLENEEKTWVVIPP
jgi:hypothetical protein